MRGPLTVLAAAALGLLASACTNATSRRPSSPSSTVVITRWTAGEATSVEPPDPVEGTRETLTRVLPIVLESILRH